MATSAAPLSLFPTAGELPDQEKILQRAKEAVERRQAQDRGKSPSQHSATSSVYIVPPSSASVSRAASPATALPDRPSLVRVPTTTSRTIRVASPDSTTSSRTTRVASPDSTTTPISQTQSSPPTSHTHSSPARDGTSSPGLYSEPSIRSQSPSSAMSGAVSRTTSVRSKPPRQFSPPPRSRAREVAPSFQSMFPMYDPDLPLQEQHYEPARMPSTKIPEKKISKMPYSPDSFGYKKERYDTKTPIATTAVPEFSSEEDLCDLWEISNGNADRPSTMKTFRLQMHRRPPPSPQPARSKKAKPRGSEPMLTFGPTSSRPFYSITTNPDVLDPERDRERELGVQVNRHNLSPLYSNPTNDSGAGSSRIAEFIISQQASPSTSPSSTASESPSAVTATLPPTPTQKQANEAAKPVPLTYITPHQAILGALSKASQSAAATRIAAFDPLASSAAAQKLAEEAMERARESCGCPLSFAPGKIGRKAGYTLHHPQIGELSIDVDGNVQIEGDGSSSTSSPSSLSSSSPSSTAPSSISSLPSLHGTGRVRLVLPSSPSTSFNFYSQPSSTPSTALPTYAATHTGGTPGTTLATLTLSDGALTLHPALFHLCPVGGASTSETPFITDVAVSALVSVLVLETLHPRVSALTTFLPPPTRAVTAPLPGGKATGIFKGRLLRKAKTVDDGAPQKGRGKTKKAADDTEQALTMAFGAAVFVLGAAVEGLHGLAEKAALARAQS